jgi:hypothetical protein
MSEQDRRAAHISNEDALRYFAEGARNRWHDHPATAFRGQQVFEMYRDILLRRLTAPDAPERGETVCVPLEALHGWWLQADALAESYGGGYGLVNEIGQILDAAAGSDPA